MPTPPGARSVKISDDERGGWSSDRPRRGGGPARPPDISVRCRVLRPSDRLRYSPGSLLIVVSPSAAERDHFAERLVSARGAVLSGRRVRELLAGRVPEEEVEERAEELLAAAVHKRLAQRETVVLLAEGLGAAEREPHLRTATTLRRPRHLVLLDAGREELGDEERSELNDLRRRLEAGELGAEGVETALRLSGSAIPELKRLAFEPAPRDD